MKRYLLFCGEVTFSPGGWNDFENSYDSNEEAKERVTQIKAEGIESDRGAGWWHIIDSKTGKGIYQGEEDKIQ